MGQQGSQLLDDIERGTHFSSEEIQRLKKRFLKLDSDGSGSIDREEFLQIPAIASNPLAQRLLLSLMQMAVDLWIFRNLYMLSVCLRAGEVKKKNYNVCTR